MKYLIYMSTAVKLLTDAGLRGILVTSQVNNTLNQITGMLLYSEGTFVQALEGEVEAVDHLYNKLQKDPRHKDVTLLAEGGLTQRMFADWSMGFKAVLPEQMLPFRAYKSPSAGTDLKDNIHPAMTILKTFADSSSF